jgi:hypothetical protein
MKILWIENTDAAKAFLVPGPGQYLCNVAVMRDLSDDLEFIRGKTGPDVGKALAVQLAKELQEGWDDAAIAGHFQVMTVTTEPAQTTVLEKAAREAFDFIAALRDCKDDAEVIDLLTNQPGEDVEARLAAALGLPEPE